MKKIRGTLCFEGYYSFDFSQ